jgi:putative FmdB family regulatory protein
MPIYAYKCGSCGHAKDVLQKISDSPLTVCPACGAAAFAKQVTAAGFQLKGSGWYATDFRGGNNGGGSKDGADKNGADSKPADSAAKPADSAAKPADAAKPANGGPGTSKPAAAAGGRGRACACH